MLAINGVKRTSASDKTSNTKTLRRQLFDLHSWLGFHLAAVMSLVLLTGTLAVLADEIDWLLRAEMRISPSLADPSRPVNWGRMESALRDYAPQHILANLKAGEDKYFAYRALMVTEGGKGYYLHINPWTGVITGKTSALTVQRFLRDLHRYLFMPHVIGLPIVCSLAIVLAISLYTGLKTTRNWRTVALRIRTNKGVRVAVGDYHKAAGIWGIWFIVAMIITSLWYYGEWGARIAGKRFEPERPGVSATQLSRYGTVIKDVDADTLIAAAGKAYPGFQPTEIQFATRQQQAVIILGRKDDPVVRDRANRVFLDPVDASVIKVQRSAQINRVAYLNELADPIHFGDFGKLWTKLIWFVFGLALTSLSLTGVWLTWKRLRRRSLSAAQWATVPLLVAPVIIGYFYVGNYLSDGLPASEYRLTQQTVGNMLVEPRFSLDKQGQPDGGVRLLLSVPEGRPNLKAVTARFGETPDAESTMRVGLLGRYTVLTATLPPAVLAAVIKDPAVFQVTLQWFTGDSEAIAFSRQ